MPTVVDVLPQPFGWVDVPEGRVTIGDTGHLVRPFRIAKYPVTNAQFARFIEAGGYETRHWWNAAGWKKLRETGRKHPPTWRNPRFNAADQPVMPVSWYEAVAFCRWLSDSTGETITLPTDAQWQVAAQGSDGRAYPWGDLWDHTRCNNRVPAEASTAGHLPDMPDLPDGHGDRTTPVTAYAGKGDSPFGVVDMAGNVWEWCLTDFDTHSDNVDDQAVKRVLRGGALSNHRVEYFRCDCRFGYFPDQDSAMFGSFGFRLACR